MAYAALMLPPLGRRAPLPPLCEDRRGAARPRAAAAPALPAAVWGIVAHFCIDSLESALAWRHAAGGDWGAALRCMARARWGGAGDLPTVARIASLVRGWEHVPLRRLGVQATIQVHVCEKEDRWCPPVRVAYHTSLKIVGDTLLPRVRRCSVACAGWLGHTIERELRCDQMCVSLEDLGFPFTARTYTVRPLRV